MSERRRSARPSDLPGPASDGPEVVVALDAPGRDEAFAIAARLPSDCWLKVGLELFTAAGPGLLRELADRGHPLFLDLKLHDIPNTVAGAVRAAAVHGVGLLTVHASGGRNMLEAAVAAAGTDGPRLLAVTVLTSLDGTDLEEVCGKGAGDSATAVRRLAGLARAACVAGVVSSVAECADLKRRFGGDFLVATPGIRLAGQGADDQKRVATPARAAAAGADYLVVGRAITRSEDPGTALARVRADAESGRPPPAES